MSEGKMPPPKNRTLYAKNVDRKNMAGTAQNQRKLETTSLAYGIIFAVIGGLKLVIALGTQVVCAIIISQYDLSQLSDGTTRGTYFKVSSLVSLLRHTIDTN